MKLKVEVTELDKDDIINILSGFTSYSSYWCVNLDWSNKDYASAKEALIAENPEESENICREDIWAHMLMNMNAPLILTDDEGDEHSLTLEKLIKGVSMTIQNNQCSIDPDEWDAADNDVMIQNSIYDEVVYG